MYFSESDGEHSELDTKLSELYVDFSESDGGFSELDTNLY